MKKRILLIIPPISEKLEAVWYSEIYLGLAYLASLAAKAGHQIKVIDCDSEFHPLLSLENKVKKFKPDIIGLTSLYGSLNNAFKIAKKLKQKSNTKIVMGGLPATFIPEHILKNCKDIDILVRGEGEYTFMDIIEGKKISEIDGISYKKNGTITHNNERKPIQDLDELGFPLRKIFPLKKYKIRAGFGSRKSTAIETSRGCPYGCSFCVQSPKEGRKLRLRSPTTVVNELYKISLEHKKIKRVMIVDNDFLTNPPHAKQILKSIIDKKLNKRFEYMIATRVNNLLKEGDELLKLLYRANVRTIYFGIEAVGKKHRCNIGKIKSFKNTLKLFKRLEKLDIDPLASYIFGFPDENKKDIETTLRFAKFLNTKNFSFNILTPYPKTPLFNIYHKKNLIENYNYNDFDNAHKILKNPKNIETSFKKIHRKYILRSGFLKEITIYNLFKRQSVGRISMVIYYLLFWEIRTILRSVKRNFKKNFKETTFET